MSILVLTYEVSSFLAFASAFKRRSCSTQIAESVAVDDISIVLPCNWNNNSNDWSKAAAAKLENHGAVALLSPTEEGLVDQHTCDNANQAAFTRVTELHNRIESRGGLDPHGIDQPYRFAEIVCRDDGGRRFDVPIPWFGGDGNCDDIGTPLTSTEKNAFKDLHLAIDEIVKPVMNAMWSQDSNVDASFVTAAGFLMNKPGSQAQNWHRDGPNEGFIDCFVPLIDLNESVGPTQIQTKTHTSNTSVEEVNINAVTPLLAKGNVLLFDYRTIHRGLGNRSESTTRTLAYAVSRKKEKGSLSNLGDIHNFPAALTLEYD